MGKWQLDALNFEVKAIETFLGYKFEGETVEEKKEFVAAHKDKRTEVTSELLRTAYEEKNLNQVANNMTTYKVFSIDGCDYVVAKSEEEAKRWYEQFIPRGEIEECFEGEVSLDKQIVISKGELTESEHDRVIKILGNIIPEQEESFKVSLNDWLKVMLSTPTDEPFIIASTEY